MAEERTFDEHDAESLAFNVQVGERLRSIRRQKKMSLQDVELQSQEEFKASVVGAYERGERAISLPRLRRLATFYVVAIEQLLPRDDFTGDASAVVVSEKLVIDLQKLAMLKGQEFDMLSRFLSLIQVQRGDFNGKVLTVRNDDIRAIAAMINAPTDDVGKRLESLGILFKSSQQN